MALKSYLRNRKVLLPRHVDIKKVNKTVISVVSNNKYQYACLQFFDFKWQFTFRARQRKFIKKIYIKPFLYSKVTGSMQILLDQCSNA